VPGVQTARRHLRDERARRAVPGPGDTGRLRRAVPELRPRLLRLLRADGGAQHGGAGGALAGAGRRGARAAARVPQARSATSSCASTSRRGCSRASCAAAASRRRPT
jgi:hypothetical protein